MKDIKNVISGRLKTLQEKRGVSNVELATATDINKASISQYRSGSREPDAESLVKIAKYFNVSVDYLLGINDIESANITEQETCKRMHLTKDALDKWDRMIRTEEQNFRCVENNFDEFVSSLNDAIAKFHFFDFLRNFVHYNMKIKESIVLMKDYKAQCDKVPEIDLNKSYSVDDFNFLDKNFDDLKELLTDFVLKEDEINNQLNASMYEMIEILSTTSKNSRKNLDELNQEVFDHLHDRLENIDSIKAVIYNEIEFLIEVESKKNKEQK